MFVSENNEENENYDVQDSEILNTKEATRQLWLYVWAKDFKYKNHKISPPSCLICMVGLVSVFTCMLLLTLCGIGLAWTPIDEWPGGGPGCCVCVDWTVCPLELWEGDISWGPIGITIPGFCWCWNCIKKVLRGIPWQVRSVTHNF